MKVVWAGKACQSRGQKDIEWVASVKLEEDTLTI
jgi:hypothetical protein